MSKQCTCDNCGTIATIDFSKPRQLPEKWMQITISANGTCGYIPGQQKDLCESCANKLGFTNPETPKETIADQLWDGIFELVDDAVADLDP